MKNLLNPKWIFLVNTLPILVLGFLAFGDFSVIKSLLKPENLDYWFNFSYLLLWPTIINIVYAIYLIINKKKISFIWATSNLIGFSLYLYLYGYNFEKIIPFDIPNWMLSGNLFLYVGTFLMPTLAYSLFVLMVHFTPKDSKSNAFQNFAYAVLIPIGFYLFAQIVLPLWQRPSTEFETHVFIILLICATIFFLFFITRFIYILVTKKSKFLQKYELVWKILIALVLPILGLFVNQGFLFNDYKFRSENNSGIMGDFSNYWFFVLAIINGILVCLPDFKNKNLRFSIYFLRSITFAFTLYFFLVFLPFFTISVIAVIGVGIGFLMLTPLVLFVLHSNILHLDFNFLKNYFSKNLLYFVSIIGFLLIPIVITFNFLQDKKTLNSALEYVYSPNYSKNYNINTKSLEKTLSVVENHKERNSEFGFGSDIPYITAFYNWLVLDNLTISDKKLEEINQIFFNKKPFEQTINRQQESNVSERSFVVSKITTESKFDETQNAYKTWVNFEIKCNNEIDFQDKFSTVFYLPETAFISDYYLEIDGKKEFGILAEKKSALWTFNQIVNYRKDPGILYYLTGNKVAFEIFPFVKGETRKTGIEFLHKEPFVLNFENQEISLGNSEVSMDKKFDNDNLFYISKEDKSKLKEVYRKPYFVFLVDVSSESKNKFEDYLLRIKNLKKQYSQFSENSKILTVDDDANDYGLKDNHFKIDFEGGYFLDRAIRKTLVESYEKKELRFPVIIAVTDSIKNAVLDKDFADLKFAFPEQNEFYILNNDGGLSSHSLLSNPKLELRKQVILDFKNPVLEFKSKNTIAYLSKDDETDFVLKKEIFATKDSDFKEKNFNSGMNIFAKNRSQILHPEISEKEWKDNVKYSFLTKIMSPFTSYLVVENEAQKQALLRKQKQVLSGNKNLDLDEEIEPMSEPNIWIVAIFLSIIIWFRNRRRNKFTVLKINSK